MTLVVIHFWWKKAHKFSSIMVIMKARPSINYFCYFWRWTIYYNNNYVHIITHLYNAALSIIHIFLCSCNIVLLISILLIFYFRNYLEVRTKNNSQKPLDSCITRNSTEILYDSWNLTQNSIQQKDIATFCYMTSLNFKI